MTAWTRDRVEALGPTTNVPTLADIFGVNSETVYAAIRRDEWTATRVLRLGRSIKIPTLDIIRLLFAPEMAATPPILAVPAPCQHDENAQFNAMESHTSCGCTPAFSGSVRPLRQVT